MDTLCTSNQCTWALLPPSRPQREHYSVTFVMGVVTVTQSGSPVSTVYSDIVTGQGGATVCAGRGPCWRYLCNFDIFKINVLIFKYLFDMRSTDSEMSENIQKCLLVSSAVKYLSIYLHNIFQTHTHKHIQTNSLYCMLVKSPPPFGSRIYDQVKHTNCLNIVTVQFYI